MIEEPKRRGRPAIKLEELSKVLVSENPTLAPSVEGEAKTQWESSEYSENTPESVISADTNTNQIYMGAPSGYQPMSTAPKDKKIVITETGEDQLCVYWRPRRIVDKKNLRYIVTGAWTSDLSRLDIDFEPAGWRPYVATDYIPIPRAK